MGFAVPAMTATVLSSVDRSRSGTASAVLNAARQTGGAIGVAVFGALVGDTPAQIVRGLGISALVSVGLIFVATIVAWKRIRRNIDTSGLNERIEFQMEVACWKCEQRAIRRKWFGENCEKMAERRGFAVTLAPRSHLNAWLLLLTPLKPYRVF